MITYVGKGSRFFFRKTYFRALEQNSCLCKSPHMRLGVSAIPAKSGAYEFFNFFSLGETFKPFSGKPFIFKGGSGSGSEGCTPKPIKFTARKTKGSQGKKEEEVA